jgi:hypothetical protein
VTPEEEGNLLARQIFDERLDELRKLSQYMRESGKLEHEYIICDNWNQIIDGLDKGEVIPYECWCVPKLAANTII